MQAHKDSGYVPLFLEGWKKIKDKKESESEEGGNEEKKKEDEEYMRTMKDLQFNYCKLYGGEYKHHYINEISNCYSTNRGRTLRLAQETGALANSLPLNDSSSVFVRVDEDRIDVMSALITGPSDTPYSNGCFVFDIFFPSDYPNGPPHVWLKTTGSNTFRFNPNLYDTGKVCLSLLGTWSGAQGETWNKDTSTFLQVLVSIQSLILVPDPYFNEPGYERDIGTSHGRTASRNYNTNIREGCVRFAMIDQLRNPPRGFEDIIRNHFRLRKKAILNEFKKWTDDSNSEGYYNSKLGGYMKEFEVELSKL